MDTEKSQDTPTGEFASLAKAYEPNSKSLLGDFEPFPAHPSQASERGSAVDRNNNARNFLPFMSE